MSEEERKQIKDIYDQLNGPDGLWVLAKSSANSLANMERRWNIMLTILTTSICGIAVTGIIGGVVYAACTFHVLPH